MIRTERPRCRDLHGATLLHRSPTGVLLGDDVQGFVNDVVGAGGGPGARD